jgi:hypothetical protein
MLGSFVKNQFAVAAWIYVCVSYSTGLRVTFCANTMLLLLLWLYSIVWSQVIWCILFWTLNNKLPCCDKPIWLAPEVIPSAGRETSSQSKRYWDLFTINPRSWVIPMTWMSWRMFFLSAGHVCVLLWKRVIPKISFFVC